MAVVSSCTFSQLVTEEEFALQTPVFFLLFFCSKLKTFEFEREDEYEIMD